MKPNVYVIIVTFNAMKWAERCFSSLRKSSIPLKTIVVDNGSNDGTQDYIKENFQEIEFIQSFENLGFGKANNLGIETAYKNGADFFYLMNQDAWLYFDAIEKLLHVYEKYPIKEDIGILSPMHLDGTEKKTDIFLDKYIAQNFEKTRIISDFYLGNIQDHYEISFVNAAHWLLPKDTVEIVGGFNPYFFHYGEDNEYVNRLHYFNKKILLCPNSRVVHDGKQELSKVDYKKYTDTTIDTKILDPNYHNSYSLEIKELKKSYYKNLLMMDFLKAKNTSETLKRIKKNKNLLFSLRHSILHHSHPFLNL